MTIGSCSTLTDKRPDRPAPPDLLYTDGGIPFDEYGLSTVAELYNMSASMHGGKVDAVYCSKMASDCSIGTCLVDHERGVADAISEDPLADRYLHRRLAITSAGRNTRHPRR